MARKKVERVRVSEAAPVEEAGKPAMVNEPEKMEMKRKKLKRQGLAVVLYGTGGSGKTTLAMNLPGSIAYADLDNSLPDLMDEIEENGYDITPIEAETYLELRGALHSKDIMEFDNVVIDTGTKLQELIITHVLKTMKNEDGEWMSNIEEYGYEKGYRFVYRCMDLILTDLDFHRKRGTNVVIICHDDTTMFQNPAGDNFLRYEPRLIQTKRYPVRNLVKEWCRFMWFLYYDASAKKGKADQSTDTGTRMIRFQERNHCMAKSRAFKGALTSLPDVAAAKAVWDLVIKK
jgi:hypothetical protein